MSTQGTHTTCDSVDGKYPIGSPIPVLFYSRPPLAISWLVIAIIIDAIKSQSVRLSHIVKKVLEYLPSFAYYYSSSAVILILLIVWIQNSRQHARPYHVNLCVHSFSGVSVLDRVLSTTTRHLPSPEIPGANFFKFSATALAKVVNQEVAIWLPSAFCLLNYSEFAEGLTDNMNFTHNIALFSVVFSGEMLAATNSHCDFGQLATKGQA
jgi:hypothetical protein